MALLIRKFEIKYCTEKVTMAAAAVNVLEVRRIAEKMFALFNLTTFCVSFNSDVSTPLFYLHLREREPSGVGVLSRDRKWEKVVMIGGMEKLIIATDPFISNSYGLQAG